MRKWSEKVAKNSFCKKWEIFAKRFFLSAGNPSRDTCIDFLTLQGSYLSTLLFSLMMFFFRVGRAGIILLSLSSFLFYLIKLLYFKVSARKGTADPIHLKATELITLFSLWTVSKSLLVLYLWFLPCFLKYLYYIILTPEHERKSFLIC